MGDADMSEAVPICVTYTYEFEDHAAFHALCSTSVGYKRYSRRTQSVWLLAFATTAPILTIADMVVTAQGKLLEIGITGAVLVWITAFMFTSLFHKTHLRSLFSLFYSANRTFTDCLSDDGVSSDSGKVRTFYTWSSIIRLETTADHLVLFISALQGIVLPRRAFASTDDFDAAIAFARERVARP